MTAIGVLHTGACTSIGLSAAAAAAAVRTGVAGFAEYSGAMDRLGEPVITAAPPGLDAIEDPVAALCEMAAAALFQLPQDRALRAILVLPEERPGLPNGFAQHIAKALSERLDGAQIALSSGSGHAGFGMALQQVDAHLKSHPNAIIAIVAVDSYLAPETLAWLETHRQLHTPYNAWGFIPGAAAAACLLCRPHYALTEKRPMCAIVEAVEVDREDAPIKSEGVCLGWAMSRIVEKLTKNQPQGPTFDSFYCDQNGEPYRADELGFMLARHGNQFSDPSTFFAPADCWGDVGAASIPLFIALAAQAADRGYAPGPISLHLAGSESGLRAGVRLRTSMKGD